MAHARRESDVAPEESRIITDETRVEPDMDLLRRTMQAIERRDEETARDLRSQRRAESTHLAQEFVNSTQEDKERRFQEEFPPQQVTYEEWSRRYDQKREEKRRYEEMRNYERRREGGTEAMLKAFATSITSLLERFTEVSKQPKFNQSHIETYEGRVEEDPGRFIEIIEHHLVKLEIQDDTDKTSFFRAQLRGEAKKWAETIRNAPVSYDAFLARFRDEFNSPRRQVKAYHRFFAGHQRENETAEEFITFKQALLARLRPNMSGETTIEMIISLLKPALSSRIIGTRPSTIEELISHTTRGARSEQGISVLSDAEPKK